LLSLLQTEPSPVPLREKGVYVGAFVSLSLLQTEPSPVPLREKGVYVGAFVLLSLPDGTVTGSAP
jgi:hypothetical protein